MFAGYAIRLKQESSPVMARSIPRATSQRGSSRMKWLVTDIPAASRPNPTANTTPPRRKLKKSNRLYDRRRRQYFRHREDPAHNAGEKQRNRGGQAAEQSDVCACCMDAHETQSADYCHREDAERYSRAKQKETAHADSRRALRKERAQCVCRRKWGYIRRSMPERRCRGETRSEKQDVNRCQRNQ